VLGKARQHLQARRCSVLRAKQFFPCCTLLAKKSKSSNDELLESIDLDQDEANNRHRARLRIALEGGFTISAQKTDQVGRCLEEFRSRIAEICRPVLEHGYRASPKKPLLRGFLVWTGMLNVFGRRPT
jgi:hypothetical protein